jgi:hypothetical protein
MDAPSSGTLVAAVPRSVLRLSATVTPKFFLLYHFSPLLFPLFFHLPQRFPLNTPLYPRTTIKYHFLYQLSIFLSTNNYSWTHNTVFRVMNSDTLDLGGERRGPTRRGRCRGHRCGRGVPPTAGMQVEGMCSVYRCAQPNAHIKLQLPKRQGSSTRLPASTSTVSHLAIRNPRHHFTQ